MLFCKSCGTRMRDTDHFCGKCGAAVTSTHASHTTPPHFHYTSGTTDETASFDPADIEANRVVAGLSYFLFFLPFILCPQSRYARFHANQGLLILIVSLAAGMLHGILSVVFSLFNGYALLGALFQGLWIIPRIIFALVNLLVFVLWVVGLVNGFSGRARSLPIIGRFRLI